MKIIWEIFPQTTEQWKRYFDYCINSSKTFYPIRMLFFIGSLIVEFILETLLRLCLIIMFPVTRIELRIRSNRAKKRFFIDG